MDSTDKVTIIPNFVKIGHWVQKMKERVSKYTVLFYHVFWRIARNSSPVPAGAWSTCNVMEICVDAVQRVRKRQGRHWRQAETQATEHVHYEWKQVLCGFPNQTGRTSPESWTFHWVVRIPRSLPVGLQKCVCTLGSKQPTITKLVE